MLKIIKVIYFENDIDINNCNNNNNNTNTNTNCNDFEIIGVNIII